MFRLDTGQARTDLYESNPLDLSIAERGIAQGRAEKFEEKQLADKQKKAREADIMSNISAMGSIEIMPRDQPLFAEKAKTIRDYAEKNSEALTNGDMQTMMEFQKLYGDYTTSAEMSKNYREKWEQYGSMIAKDRDSYDQDVWDAHFGKAASEKMGDWTDDPSIYYKNVNYLDRVTGDLSVFAQRQAKDTPYGKVFDQKQAEGLIALDLEDPQNFRQALKDFDGAEDKLGAKNAVEYYQKKYAPSLTINDTKAGPSSGGSGSSSKEPKIRANYNKTSDTSGILNWEYVTPPDNPYMTTSIGDVKPGIIHDDGANTYMEVTTKPDSDGYSENKRLGFQETADFIRLKLGTTLGELRKGQSPAHIDTKIKDVSSSVDAGKKAAEKSRKATAEDAAALAWANANPNDKRSVAIKAKLKAKGIK